jgi:PAS domain S-box-containing protein
MTAAPLPPDEPERLRALHDLHVLDTPDEERFDRITRLAARMLGVPIAIVSLVDEHRQWAKSGVGLAEREQPRCVSFCAHALLQEETLVVEDTHADPRFATNPLVVDDPSLAFYAGHPLRAPSGHKLGTLCVADHRPRRLDADDLAVLRDLAAVAERELAHEEFESVVHARLRGEERLKTLLAAVADGIATFGEDGLIETINPAAERMFGRPEAELVGRPVGELVDDEDLRELTGDASAADRGGMGRPREVVARRADGSTFPLEVTVTRMDDGPEGLHFVVVGRDVSQRKAAEAALERSRRQTELLLSSADEGIIGLDADARIVLVNPAASRMLGRPPAGAVGLHLDEAVPRTGPDGTPIPFAGSPVDQTLRDGVTRRFERVLTRADGTTFPAEVVAAATRDEGELVGAVVVFRDVTERHELDRAKDEFISVVGHELRTPLTSIRGAVGLLAGGLAPDLPPKAQRMLDIAVVNTDRLMRLINDILDLSRMESGRVELRPEPQGARELLEATVPLVSPIAGERAVTLAVDAVAARVAVDPDRMVQVLTNLVANAVKFSPEGGVVELRARRVGHEVRFEVRDQGRGIPADRLEVIFERFRQVDASDAREKGGTGLGLAIARSIVDQHGGRIWAESEAGRGSTFVVALPALDRSPPVGRSPRVLVLAVDDGWGQQVASALRARGYDPIGVPDLEAAVRRLADEPVAALLTPTPAAVGAFVQLSGPDGEAVPVIVAADAVDHERLSDALQEALTRLRPRRVLVVEDDADLAEVLAAVVGRHAETTVVHSGREAVDAVDRLHPDLVLLDLVLPEQDGFAVVEQLNRTGRLAGTALVVYTALDLARRDQERLEERGAAVLQKGETPPTMLDAHLARLLDAVSGRSPTR